MAGKAILTCRPTSHPFQDRTLILDHSVKIGRSVARARANSVNAIFDCKVLSRNHAVLWYADGKFYLQDTRSSNGTFVNNQRLSKSGEESAPREVNSGDIVQFGVDVLESTRKVTHGCIIANLKLYLPDGQEAKPSVPSVISSNSVHVEDLYELHQYIQEAVQRENLLETKLLALEEMLGNIREAANQGWKALICEDRLLTRVEALENQLQVYTSKNFGEENLREELQKLQEDKNQYQCAAKGFFKRVLEEKLEAVQNCQEVKRSLINVEAQYNDLNEELMKSREHIQDLAHRLSAQIARNEDYELKIQEIEEQHKEALTRLEAKNRELEEMLNRQHVTEACLEKQLEALREAENRSTEKPITFELKLKPTIGSDIQDESDESIRKDTNSVNETVKYSEDHYHDAQTKNKEVIDLLKAQLGLLDAEKLKRLQQINSIQDNYEEYDTQQVKFEEEYEAVELRINNLESQVRQKATQQTQSETLQFDGRESNGKIVNGLNESSLEYLESQIKELKTLRSDIKNQSNACERSKNCLKEELDQAKKCLNKTTESLIITQENLEKAQKEFEDSVVITNSLTRAKMLDEYSNDEKYPFLDNDLQNQNNINKKASEKDELLHLKKSLLEAQQREKQCKNETAQLKDKINALLSELDSKSSSSEDNKLREELEELKRECVRQKGVINMLESEKQELREECLKMRLADSSCTSSDDSRIDDTLSKKVASLEEKLVLLGTEYSKCSDEKSKLHRQLESLELDYQAITHQKYFNLFFALPCILLLLALTIAFYPTLSLFMGTADQPDQQQT